MQQCMSKWSFSRFTMFSINDKILIDQFNSVCDKPNSLIPYKSNNKMFEYITIPIGGFNDIQNPKGDLSKYCSFSLKNKLEDNEIKLLNEKKVLVENCKLDINKILEESNSKHEESKTVKVNIKTLLDINIRLDKTFESCKEQLRYNDKETFLVKINNSKNLEPNKKEEFEEVKLK